MKPFLSVYRAAVRALLMKALATSLLVCVSTSSSLAAGPQPGAAPAPGAASVTLRPAPRAPDIGRVQFLAATSAGARIVAVGERGSVALSDDSGKSFRQARSVPVQSTLTDVVFVNDRVGWAVGHWGAIIATQDGGESWTLQRQDTSVDQPLFSVHFSNEREGVAVGLWSMLLVTSDGGAHWATKSLPALKSKEKTDQNLFHVFADAIGGWLITAERGYIWQSADRGETWRALQTGYPGSLWTGVTLKNGDILVGGLRGTVYASRDKGATWSREETGTKSSLTGLAELPDGTVVGIGLDGVRVRSAANGRGFKATQEPDRTAFTALAVTREGTPVYFATDGIRKP